MKVLIFNDDEDTGGVGIALKQAFDRYPELGIEVRNVRRVNNYIDYPVDVQWPRGAPFTYIKPLFDEADVIHLMQRWQPLISVPGFDKKAVVMHHHGTIFRSDPQPFLARAREFGAVTVASTLDLLLPAPDEIRWMPNPIDIRHMQSLRDQYYRQTPRPLVVHAPTGQKKKRSQFFLDALATLDADLLLIENQPWRECLVRKARGDLLMDQLGVGYGINALESWAMGMPVICGVEDPAILDVMVDQIGYLPFFQTTIKEVPERLRRIIEDVDVRSYYTDLGNEYVHDLHDARVVAERWRVVYEEAMDRRVH